MGRSDGQAVGGWDDVTEGQKVRRQSVKQANSRSMWLKHELLADRTIDVIQRQLIMQNAPWIRAMAHRPWCN